MRKIESLKHLIVLAALMLIISGCTQQKADEDTTAMRISDREAIEDTVNRANLGFELSDADLFAGAFAEDAVFELDAKGPVFGFDKMSYQGQRRHPSNRYGPEGEVPQNRSQNTELRSGDLENVYP